MGKKCQEKKSEGNFSCHGSVFDRLIRQPALCDRERGSFVLTFSQRDIAFCADPFEYIISPRFMYAADRLGSRSMALLNSDMADPVSFFR